MFAFLKEIAQGIIVVITAITLSVSGLFVHSKPVAKLEII